MANAISSDLYLSNYSKPQKQTGNSNLGKDAFLQILITQLQNQNPTEPMDDREFIAQMAQFSSLEQMQNMTKAVEALLASQQQSQLMNYSSFVGKEIQWHEITDKKDDKGEPIINEGTGVVSQLKFVDGEAVFILADGKKLSAGNISAILRNSTSTTTTYENSIVQASMLIGKTVSYTNGDADTQAKIVSVSNKDGVISYVLNNGDKITSTQMTTISE